MEWEEPQMAKRGTSGLRGWCADPYSDAADAILRIDLDVTAAPASAERILGTAWTAITILTDGHGVPAAPWLPVIARFQKLSIAELKRVRDAVAMRQRAFERKAA